MYRIQKERLSQNHVAFVIVTTFYSPSCLSQQGRVWNGNWNGTEISVWNMEDARSEWKISRMEWKTIFHTFIRIPYWILCIVFTEKYILMLGSDK